MKNRKQSNPKTVPPANPQSETPSRDDPKSKVLEDLKNHIERVDGVPCIKHFYGDLLGDESTRSGVRASLGFVEREAHGALNYVKGAKEPNVDVLKKNFPVFSCVASDEYLQQLCNGQHNNKSAKKMAVEVYSVLYQKMPSSIAKYSRPGKKKSPHSQE